MRIRPSTRTRPMRYRELPRRSVCTSLRRSWSAERGMLEVQRALSRPSCLTSASGRPPSGCRSFDVATLLAESVGGREDEPAGA